MLANAPSSLTQSPLLKKEEKKEVVDDEITKKQKRDRVWMKHERKILQEAEWLRSIEQAIERVKNAAEKTRLFILAGHGRRYIKRKRICITYSRKYAALTSVVEKEEDQKKEKRKQTEKQ